MEIDFFMFGANIWLLVGLLLLVIAGLVLLLAAWTGVNITVWKLRKRKAQADYHRARFRPDGTSYPPSARGICDRCQTVHSRVFHVENVGRLCMEHFQEWDREHFRSKSDNPAANH